MENINGTIVLEKRVHKTGNIFTTTSKKALLFTSLPFYWLVFFNYVLNWFDFRLFAFVVIASGIMSLLGQGWGVLGWLAK